MAKLPEYRRISREDLPEAPSWFDRIIRILNSFMDSVYRALSGDLTFSENIRSQIKSFSLVAGATPSQNTFRFSRTIPSTPQGLVLLRASKVDVNVVPIASAVYIDWRYEATEIIIDSITGLNPGDTYDFRVLII